MEPLVLGIDLGTTSCKAGLVGRDGRVRRLARRPTPIRVDGDRVEHDADAFVAAALEAVTEVVGADGAAVAAVGVASAAEVGVPLDRAGEALRPMIGWADRRATATAERLAASMDRVRLWEATGLRIDAKYPALKWAWFAEHDPGALAAMRVWAGAAELVAGTLTGTRPVAATVASLACRTMAFDLRARTWDEDLLALAGLRPAQVPPVRPAGSPVGGLGPGHAATWGIRAGTPVVVAGHDHLVGALAAGARRPGDLVDSAGTAEAVALVVDDLPAATAALALGVTAGRHADGRHCYLVAGWPGAGHLVRWLGDQLVPGAPDAVEAVGRLLGAPSALPAPVIVEPYVRGRAAPAPDPHRRVAVHGDTGPDGPGADAAVVARAALEGGAFHARWMAEAVVGLAGRTPRQVVAFGGGVHAPAWAALRAAVFPWPLRRCTEAEAVVVGAAAIAGPAADCEIAVVASDAVPVDPHRASAYDRAYRERFLPIVRRPQPAGCVMGDLPDTVVRVASPTTGTTDGPVPPAAVRRPPSPSD